VSAPRIETARLLLREWRDEDVEPWIALGADARVMEFFPGTYTRVEAAATAARMRERLVERGYGWWILEVKDRAPFAGVIALQDVPFDAHFTPALEVGWRLPVDLWGNGYATEGARAALDFAFEQLGRTEVVAMTARLNRPSQRVMQRLGMTYSVADDFENPRIAPGDRLRPHVLYRMQAPNRIGDR